MRTEAKLWLTLAALLTVVPVLSACHTVHGVGEDVSAAGRGIAHAADKVAGDR